MCLRPRALLPPLSLDVAPPAAAPRSSSVARSRATGVLLWALLGGGVGPPARTPCMNPPPSSPGRMWSRAGAAGLCYDAAGRRQQPLVPQQRQPRFLCAGRRLGRGCWRGRGWREQPPRTSSSPSWRRWRCSWDEAQGPCGALCGGKRVHEVGGEGWVADGHPRCASHACAPSRLPAGVWPACRVLLCRQKWVPFSSRGMSSSTFCVCSTRTWRASPRSCTP